MTTTHSKRARGNQTNSMRHQWSFLQTNLRNKQRDLNSIKKFKKYNLPGYKSMEKAHTGGVNHTKKQISVLRARILKYQREGKINKIL